jgi:hypothetical protein
LYFSGTFPPDSRHLPIPTTKLSFCTSPKGKQVVVDGGGNLLTCEKIMEITEIHGKLRGQWPRLPLAHHHPVITCILHAMVQTILFVNYCIT